jgi:excisionase family DNA binding protein
VDIEKPLTVEQAAEAIGISRAHLYALVRRGEFPVVRFGKLTRVSQQALREFIATGGTAPHRTQAK